MNAIVERICAEIRDGKKGLVRGYVVYSQWRAGCLGLDISKDENNIEVGVAYTHWHRHDYHPEKVGEELNALFKCYSGFDEYEGCLIGYEWRDYRS